MKAKTLVCWYMSSVVGSSGVGEAGGEHWKRLVVGLGLTRSWSLRLRTGIDEELDKSECDLGFVSAVLCVFKFF